MRLIAADALKEWLDEYLSVFKKYDKSEVKGFVDHAPTIEPKRGEWKEKETFHNADDNPIIEEWQSARCSVCHKYHTTPYLYYFNDYNFCPNCGADMRGENNETDKEMR